jgi:hypothetical protein
MVRASATTPLVGASVAAVSTSQIAHVSSALFQSVASFAMEKAGVTPLQASVTAITTHPFL